MTRRKYETRGNPPKPLGSEQREKKTLDPCPPPAADPRSRKTKDEKRQAGDVAGIRGASAVDRRAFRELEQCLRERERELETRNNQLRALAGELTLTEQRERRKLAEVLHDHLQQLLVGARFRVLMLTRTADPLLRQVAHEIEQLLRESIEETRSLTTELSPPILREQGLPAGLKWLAGWMKDRHRLFVVLTIEPDVSPAAEDVAALLFESVRELLFNVVKHAQMHSAQVNVCRTNDNELQITVSDGGVGFDAASVSPPGVSGRGFGLFSISERLGLMGGRMEIKSSPGRGTRISLLAPCSAEATLALTRTR